MLARPARPRCSSPPTVPATSARASTSSPRSTWKSGCTPPGASPAASSVVRAGPPTWPSSRRLIDRPLRPSFADGYRNETQVVVTVMGVDGENPYDVVAINGASAANGVGPPSRGPSAPCASPGRPRAAGSAPDLRAGRRLDLRARRRRSPERRGRHRHHDGRGRRHRERLELYQDGTPFVTEEVIAGGLEAAKTWIRESIDAQRELVAKAEQAGLIHRSRGSRRSTTPTRSPPGSRPSAPRA